MQGMCGYGFHIGIDQVFITTPVNTVLFKLNYQVTGITFFLLQGRLFNFLPHIRWLSVPKLAYSVIKLGSGYEN